jgi:integrase
MGFSNVIPIALIAEKRTVAIRRPNAELRTGEYLTPVVDRLVGTAKRSRQHDGLVDLRWSQIDFTHATMHVRRVKGGKPSARPLQGDVMRALRRLRKEDLHGEFVFVSERGSPFSTAGFAKMIERLGVEAGFKFKVHPHMLRHSTGYKLANDGEYPVDAGLSRPSEHQAHGALYRVVADPV